MPLSLLLAEVTRPVTRVVRRGTGRWLQLLGGGAANADAAWERSPRRYRVFYNPDLRAYISVDLGAWHGRLHYYTGVYNDREASYVIRTYLRPGDTFVDAGAHHGLHTVCAAVTVGPTGRTISFEPNPRNYDLLRGHLAINRLTNAVTHNVGLSDETTELALNFSDPIRGSFLKTEETTQHVTVPVRRGDDLLAVTPPTDGRVLLKVDTEGFEHRALRGFDRLLAREDIGVHVEVTDKWLRAAGSSQDELFKDMAARGFAPYSMHTPRFGRTVHLTPMPGPRDFWQYDVLWAKPAFLAKRP